MSDQVPITPPEPYCDAWTWRAIYDAEGEDVLDEHEVASDGSIIPHTFAEIDQGRLLAFMLIPQWEGLVPHGVHLQEGQRLIFFRRTAHVANGPDAGQIRKAHVIGHQELVRGENRQSLMACFDNGSTLLVSDQAMIEP